MLRFTPVAGVTVWKPIGDLFQALYEALMRQEELLAYIDSQEEARLRVSFLFPYFHLISDSSISTALHSCCDGWGLTVTLGVPKVKPEMSAHYGLFLMGRTLDGSLFGGWKPKSDLPLLVEKYVNKEIQIDDYIRHNLPFDDINNAFDLIKEGKCLRCVIHMPR
ncbi:alcohol dehydrogenase-like 6 [Arachis ipaensis]|uniref:alcohol dehydrogenase-like 6 n=1 Tax=Arachis ipaensis TaxID=130454 RepID=UPI0007AFBB28|nr:alcohol dehydrogenase-like 6 [Arachis ipaensis]XP_025670640.1 alcohol dehydrogenase-like 6 [Arachis hypogaea]